MESWYYFCYSPVLKQDVEDHERRWYYGTREFILWKDGDFGLCFEQVVVAILGFTLLSLVSGFYCGSHGRFVRRHKPSLGPFLKAIIVFCLLINSIVQFVSSFMLVRSQPYAVILSQAVEILTWSIHLYSLAILSRSLKHIGYGPLPLNLVWGLTLLYAILDFRTAIQYVERHSLYSQRELNPLGYLSSVLRITSYVRFGLQVVYFILLIVPAKRLFDNQLVLATAGSTQYQDRVPILSGSAKEDDIVASEDVDYGAINHKPRRFKLTSEDNANPLSLLSFWWLTSLMRRGAAGFLQSPSDLPVLPRSLSTAHVREKFQRVLQRRYQRDTGRAGDGGAVSEHTLRSLDRLSQYSREQSISYGPISEADDDNEEEKEHYLTISSSTPILPPSDDPPTITTTNQSRPSSSSPFSLIHTLNRAFGLHYYPLGLMKLAGDCLGFSGPLLLHQLVGFMENRTVGIYMYINSRVLE